MEKREIDKEVCEKVLGWSDMHWEEARKSDGTANSWNYLQGWYGKGPETETYLSNPPSQTLYGAHEVIKSMAANFGYSFECYYFLQPGFNIKFHCNIDKANESVIAEVSHDFPLAVCKAALRIISLTAIAKRVEYLEAELSELKGKLSRTRFT